MCSLAGLLAACALSSDGVPGGLWALEVGSGSKSASAEGETGRQGPGGGHLGSSESSVWEIVWGRNSADTVYPKLLQMCCQIANTK